jgi:hypothetical protein
LRVSCTWGIAFCLSSLAVAGCGERTGTVTGKVTYNGAILKGGQVTFVSQEKKPETDSVKPPPGGIPKYAPPPGMTPPGGYNPGGGVDPKEMARRYVPIPKKYADPAQSGQTMSVTGGSQTHDIVLKD